MKYIRTKDGIYKTDSPIQPEKELQIKRIDEHCFETSWKTKPCEWRVADTIEELCDECVVISKYAKKPKIMSFYEAEYFINNYVNKIKSADPIIAIYGAIWVQLPNGAWKLEPVAKMNEKGELELL